MGEWIGNLCVLVTYRIYYNIYICMYVCNVHSSWRYYSHVKFVEFAFARSNRRSGPKERLVLRCAELNMFDKTESRFGEDIDTIARSGQYVATSS